MGARAKTNPQETERETRGVRASGLTFDTGVLIALERRKARAWRVARAASAANVTVTVPTAVIAEWWRGRTDARVHVRSIKS